MNYNNMYPNRMNDNIDPNYIYPQPYIDPLMYMNPYVMNNIQSPNFNPYNNQEYSTYSNQYVDNPQFNPYDESDNNIPPEFENNINNPSNNIPMIPMMPPNMMFPGMMMPPNMMYPPGMVQNMMFPGMMMPPNMMYPPGMMQGMPTINMEEFDEEEM